MKMPAVCCYIVLCLQENVSERVFYEDAAVDVAYMSAGKC